MKKIMLVFFVLAALMLSGCDTASGSGSDSTNTPETPVVTTPETPAPLPSTPEITPETPTTTKTVYVKNSKWETVKTVTITVAARDVAETTPEELQDEVLDYNLANTDDQYTIIEEDTPIAEAPVIDIYLVNPTTHEVNEEYLDKQRTEYVEYYDLYVLQAAGSGSVMYVDQIPPAPIPAVDTRTPYEKYALYLLDADGKIMYEEHCADVDLATTGAKSIDEWYALRKACYELQARCDGKGEQVVAGRIYTAPAE